MKLKTTKPGDEEYALVGSFHNTAFGHVGGDCKTEERIAVMYWTQNSLYKDGRDLIM